jgi:RNA polymerase sigma factor (sigma-70 family)
MEDLSDGQILQLLRSGVKEKINKAFVALYSNYGKIKSMVIRKSGDETDAKSVFHDSLIILHGKVKEKDFQLRSSLSTFLYSICKNLWKMELRKRKREKGNNSQLQADSNQKTKEDSIEKKIIDEEIKEWLRLKIKQLSPDCQKVLNLYYYDKKSMNEIAEIMKYSNNNVARNKKYKCLKKLIENIGDQWL